jgi:hypothetical protein
MKTVNKSAETTRSFDQLISMLSENEILKTDALTNIRGGNADGEGDGGSSIIIRPKF